MGVRVRSEALEDDLGHIPAREPSGATAAALVALTFLLLLVNGRPIPRHGAGGEAPNAFVSALAAPVFAACGAIFTLDETGKAMAGKLASSLFAALAGGAIFVAVARRRSESEGTVAALVLALGTTVWPASQRLSADPLAALGIAAALLFLSRAEDRAL